MAAPTEGRVPDRPHRSALGAALARAELTPVEVWTRYFALGGDLDPVDVEAHLADLVPLPDRDADLLAHVVNERLDELTGRLRVPYSHPVRQRRPADGPLAALVGLLEAARSAPPERVPALAADAGRALGVEVRVHLVAEDQQVLVPVPGEGCAPLRVDGTLAGRAFRDGHVLPDEGAGGPRLWVPLLDGADRLGVLGVRVPTDADLYDPVLRDHCRWFADVLGHLVAGLSVYGDALARVRRSQPHTAAAELVHQQLPPLTAATDDVVLAGLVEPAHAAGGDVFDYALSEDAAQLALYDAVGHGMSAGLVAAAALAAARAARRDGGGLAEQARAVDDTVAASFPHSAFVTAVLAHLDLRSGVLRYVGAGHPPPLLVRRGRVVRSLTGGRRLPLGLGSPSCPVAEETLEPGDWLVVYTDGITEARDPQGRWFGEERLVDLLARAVAAGSPPPETVRRLVQAVLEHQRGLLQDDATVLLLCWHGRSSD